MLYEARLLDGENFRAISGKRPDMSWVVEVAAAVGDSTHSH